MKEKHIKSCLEFHDKYNGCECPCHTLPQEEKITINQFGRDLLERAINVGFTEAQLKFLADNFEFTTEDYD